jgi:uncharacterized protein YbbC (DUF1343 family)
MGTFDVILVDMQDLGCRIYTFITTLLYVLEAAAEHGKAVWVLDRPNPAGRPVEGLTLLPGWESFVGAGPMPMRHGLTLGELGHWFIASKGLKVDYRVIEMEGTTPPRARLRLAAGRAQLDQPQPQRPEPVHGPRLCRHGDDRGGDPVRGARHDPAAGAVRRAGHRRPEGDRADAPAFAPQWLNGCRLRDIWFQPTFHKHVGQLCNGVQIHVDDPAYDHEAFRPWRVQALGFKAIRTLYPDYDLWRDFPYEYVFDKLAIDVINGGPGLREWVDDRRRSRPIWTP